MSKSEQVREGQEVPDAATAIPPTPPTLRPRDIMLIDFLREHDAACPVCGYNVRALTRPICPECKQELTLTVGAARLRMGWLFAAVAPGFFSGIAACFMLVPIFGRLLFGDGVLMAVPIMMDLFGWCSGIFAIILAIRGRNRFLAQSPARQRWFALIIWLIHIAALGLFILIGVVFF
jgi:hypothetical protein